MSTDALVSVIIPTYNYGRFIAKAIDSVLEQDYPHVEVIVVDDGSSDGTEEIVRNTYGEKVRCFFQSNKGVSSARNHGLKKVKGDFIVFLDADDWLGKSAIRNRLECFYENPICGWVYGRCRYINMNGKDVTAQYEKKHAFAYTHERSGNILNYLLLGELIHTPTIMIRRVALQGVGCFKEGVHHLEDYDFWLRIAAASTAGFVHSDDVFVLAHDDSASRSADDHYQTSLDILLDAEALYPENVQALGRQWQKRISGVQVHRAMHLLVDGDVDSGRKLIKSAIYRYPWNIRNYFYWFRTLM